MKVQSQSSSSEKTSSGSSSVVIIWALSSANHYVNNWEGGSLDKIINLFVNKQINIQNYSKNFWNQREASVPEMSSYKLCCPICEPHPYMWRDSLGKLNSTFRVTYENYKPLLNFSKMKINTWLPIFIFFGSELTLDEQHRLFFTNWTSINRSFHQGLFT